MSDLTKWFGNKICRWIAGVQMPEPPYLVYVGLFNGDPKLTGEEVTDTIRVAGRVAVSWTALAEGVGNVLQSDEDADFGNSAGSVASLTHCAIFDGPDEYANMIAAKALPGQPLSVSAGASVMFPAGDLSFTIGE